MAMTYDSNLGKERIVEITNLADKYIQLGANSVKLVTKPLFILPNGNVYSDVSDHYDANFYVDIRDNIKYLYDFVRRLEVLDSFPFKDSKKTHFYKREFDRYLFLYRVLDQIYLTSFYDYMNDLDYPKILQFVSEKFGIDFKMAEVKENNYDFFSFAHYNKLEEKAISIVVDCRDDLDRLKRLDGYYLRDYFKINQNGLSLYDARNYINRNCLDFFTYCSVDIDRNMTGFYNDNGKEIVKRLIEAKHYTLNSFIGLLEKVGGTNLLEQFESLIELPYYIYDDKFDWKGVNKDFLKDFAVMFLGFDKIETQVSNTISSSRLDLYKEYFNYYLMDWNLVQLPKIVLDEDTLTLKKIEPNDYSLDSMEDNKYKEEAQLIKRKVPLNERHNYFI